MPDCPTVQQLVDNVKSLTKQNDGTFQTAWADSFIDPYHCCEQGGFIYVDYPVLSPLTRAYIVRAPKGSTMNQRTTGPNAAIDLNKPGIGQNGVVLVANFHTHPLSRAVGGDPQPSRADKDNAYVRGVPGIVISRDGVYGYGPDKRVNLDNLKGYPPRGVDPPAIPNAVLVKRNPPPWVAEPNQWPEGTSTAAVMANVAEVVGEGAEVEVEGEENDVVMVEWSGEDVDFTVNVEDRED